MDKTESLSETLAKQAEARFSASAATEKRERNWISTLLPAHKDLCESTSLTFHDLLKDGIILCELLNVVTGTQFVKYSTMSLPFKQMENISSYLVACEKLGMSQTELFETSDLFTAKNLQLVLQHLCALHMFIDKHGDALKSKAEQFKANPAVKRNVKNPLSESISPSTSSHKLNSSPIKLESKSASPSKANLHSSHDKITPTRPKAPSVTSLASDIATKEEFKYNPEVEKAAQKWIEQMLDMKPTGLSFYNFTKSGVVLCQLANKIQPNVIPHIYEGSLAYRQMENIGSYISACQQFGLKDVELFETADLFTERNLNSVVNHIHVLAHFLEKKPNWNGPLIEDVRDAKSLFSATLVEESWDKVSTGPVVPLTDEQIELKNWANSKLKEVHPPVQFDDLSTDVRSGVKLVKLLGVLCRDQSVGSINQNPTMVWHAMQNASAILSFITSHTFEKVEGVRAVDIVTGNALAIQKLFFYLRAKFDLDYLFAQTLGIIEDGEEVVELIEGCEVPDHIRPLLSAEELQMYDMLAQERKQQDLEELQGEKDDEVRRLEQELANQKKPDSDNNATNIIQNESVAVDPSSELTHLPEEIEEIVASPTPSPEHFKPLVPTSAVEVLNEQPKEVSKRDTSDSDADSKPKVIDLVTALPIETVRSSDSNPSPIDAKPISAHPPSSEISSSPRKNKDKTKDSSSPRKQKSDQSSSPAAIVRGKSKRDNTPELRKKESDSWTKGVPTGAQEHEATNLDGTKNASSTTQPADIQTRIRSHVRVASTPRRITVKRAPTTAAGLSDLEKVSRAQQVVRKHVAVECLTTEQSYLNSLQVLINQFLKPLKSSKILTSDEYDSLFSNIEQIASEHMKFEHLLRNRISNWDDNSIASDIFLNHTQFFVHYGPYLQNYNKATVSMHYIKKKHPKFDTMLKAFEDELMKTTMQTVDSFLIMPVQRLPRYRLLLSDMRKYTSVNHAEYKALEEAVQYVDKVLIELNSHIDRDGGEQQKKVLQIASSIQGDHQVMKTNRKFLREGPLYIKKIKLGTSDKSKTSERKKLAEKMSHQKVYGFLFNDCLVLCETLKQAKSEDVHQFNYLGTFSVVGGELITEKERIDKGMEAIGGFQIKKHPEKKVRDVILYWHLESDLIVVHTASMEDRDAWLKAFPKP